MFQFVDEEKYGQSKGSMKSVEIKAKQGFGISMWRI